MAVDNVTMLVGGAAAICTTLSFVPQLVKIHRQGGRDLSDSMLGLYLLGLTLWLVYGVRIRAAEVIGANVVAGTLVIAAVVMKHRSGTSAGEGGRTRARARTLADADCKAEILARVRALQPDSVRRWGRMTAHQMVCHLIDCNRMALGELVVTAPAARVPRAIVKWVSLHTPVPWPAGLPTNPELDQEVGGMRPDDFAGRRGRPRVDRGAADVEGRSKRLAAASGLRRDVRGRLAPLGLPAHESPPAPVWPVATSRNAVRPSHLTRRDAVDENSRRVSDNTNPNDLAPIRQLTAHKLKALLDSGAPIELVDVRTEQERAVASHRRLTPARSGVSRCASSTRTGHADRVPVPPRHPQPERS